MVDATTLVIFALIGALGGLARGLVGLRKAYLNKETIDWSYFSITVLGALIIGLIVGAVFGTSQTLAFVMGYAGTDFLEGLMRATSILPPK